MYSVSSCSWIMGFVVMDIKSEVLIILLFSAASLSQDVNKEVNSQDCKLMFTYGYGYNKFFHISESGSHYNSNITIHFLVRARSDAHLLLSSSPAPAEGQAVYEIVLGAGKNTFSDIRRMRRTATKATAHTVDLLSPVELRGFWLNYNGKGTVQVGKEGEEFPFLFWNDPSPLDIQYFSFCTWTGVVGKWLYACPVANDTEEIDTVEPKPTTMTEKLRKDLLSSYNPYSLPVLHEEHRVAVFMHLTFHHVLLDVKRSVFRIDGIIPMELTIFSQKTFHCLLPQTALNKYVPEYDTPSIDGEVMKICNTVSHWIDEKIQWKPEDYGGLTSINTNENEVWTPEVVLYNAVGHGVKILGHAGITITSKGVVMWSPPTHLEVWCNLNLDQWPNDMHTCELQLGFWSQEQFVDLLIAENETVMQDAQQTGTEWDVTKMESETIITHTPWNLDADTDISISRTLIICITVQRQSQPQNIILVTPLMVISVLIMLSFWMTPVSSGRFSIQCMCLVLLAIFTVTVGNALPPTAEHVPRLVLVYSWSMIAGVLSLLVSTLLISISRYAHATPPPNFLCAFITYPFTQILLFLPQVKEEMSKTYNQLEEDVSDVNQSCSDDTTKTSAQKHLEIQQYWIILSTAIDRISCIIYFIFCLGTLIKYI